MKCHICDKTLSETEVKFNRLADEWEPCGTCLKEISEIFEDYVPDEELIEENQSVDDLVNFSLDNID